MWSRTRWTEDWYLAARWPLALVLLGLGAWTWEDGDHWPGAFLIAVGIAYPLSRALVHRPGGRPARFLGLPSVAIQPAILVTLILVLSVCELAGIGFRRDVGRGVLGLFAFAAGAYGVLLLARAFRSRD
jgi:hypothetical protein